MNQHQNFNNNYNFGQNNNNVGNLGKLPSGIPSGRQDSSNKYKFGDAKKPGLVINKNRNAMNILGNNMNPMSGNNDRINSGISGISGSGINSGNKNSNNNAP